MGRWRDRLYSIDIADGLAVADPATGEIVDRIDIAQKRAGLVASSDAPAIARRRLFVSAEDGNLLVFEGDV